MKRILLIALVVPSFVCAMKPEKKETPQLKLSQKNKLYAGVQTAALTHDILHTTTILPFPYGIPMTVLTSAAIIGGEMLYNSYQNYKVQTQNLENNK